MCPYHAVLVLTAFLFWVVPCVLLLFVPSSVFCQQPPPPPPQRTGSKESLRTALSQPRTFTQSKLLRLTNDPIPRNKPLDWSPPLSLSLPSVFPVSCLPLALKVMDLIHKMSLQSIRMSLRSSRWLLLPPWFGVPCPTFSTLTQLLLCFCSSLLHVAKALCESTRMQRYHPR
jgi:hypothetical protein